MTQPTIYIGQTALKDTSRKVSGEFVQIDSTDFYKISHYDQMQPFFISIVSDSDHWLYISSSGGLTAGRRNPGNSLFPYYTDDKIHDSGELTGSKTVMLVEKDRQTYLWEPFSDRYRGAYQISRHLYKSINGNQLIFEEVNEDLGLVYSYGWHTSEQYGFVKKSRLYNRGASAVQVRILDGMQNLLPYGVVLKLQTESSTLLDAYKKNELLKDSGLGLFLLSSVPVDKAEPSEALKATTVWSTGLDVDHYLLSTRQLGKFRKGQELETEMDVRAERGAYLLESNFALSPQTGKTWYFAAELQQGPAAVAALDAWLRKGEDLPGKLEQDISKGTHRLRHIIASADGLQRTADRLMTTRHFANVLFNVMRGGIFEHHYDVQEKDLAAHIHHFNHQVAKRQADFLDKLPDRITYLELINAAAATGDADLHRLCLEYLPLMFSRRHGDPSRPWNRFSIELRDEDGNKKLYYEGNWRDIFQNWEALALSYPLFLSGMISKFVNASTADGYNPYRITRYGIDWEVIEEDDPWSYIGYWGDHQIIYLLKLMELSAHCRPGELADMLNRRIFAFANVPYRIKSYRELLANPHDTVDFDHRLEEEINKRVELLGADGKLVWNEKGDVYLVNLSEKILVSLLAKVSNFIPEAGIWLNTQRPEWNDANNALVGYGVSMVTLYYMRRFVTFCQDLFGELGSEDIPLSEEVAALLESITQTLEAHHDKLAGPIDDTLRRKITDALGEAGNNYRTKVYSGFSEKQQSVELENLHRFFSLTLDFIDHSIRANRRSDNLYHAYNLMQVKEDGGIGIRYLYEMLEGQVAVLSSGLLSPAEALDLLQALRLSKLYRADQHSYVLYPDRQLPRFELKNNIPARYIEQSDLLKRMIEKGDRRVIEKDVNGQYHFNGNFNNGKDVESALSDIPEREYPGLLNKHERQKVLDIFETIFDHQSFTGRSGTFFGYEGLGSIYWHMVSKLLLAVQEVCWQAIHTGAAEDQIKQLIDHYYDIRSGIGFYKNPDHYGAFPFDPYSHTPGNAGAQQPGMTGQVKEDILSRFGELGVSLEKGQIVFRPRLLRREEFLQQERSFSYFDLDGSEKEIMVPANALAFTYCQVPVIYRLAEDPGLMIHVQGESALESSELAISPEWSREIMGRSGKVKRIEVRIDGSSLVV